MIFHQTAIQGCFGIELEPRYDERGFFARTWCADEFAKIGVTKPFVQNSISFTRQKGSFRGMHYQTAPHEEIKLVRCTRGAVFDVVLDIRPGSTTFGKWIGIELSDSNHRMLLVPEGCAHGFQTLDNDCEFEYQITARYAADAATGLRWNDPAFAIELPLPVSCIAERDRSYPDFVIPAGAKAR